MTVSDLIKTLSGCNGTFPVNFHLHNIKSNTMIDWYTDTYSTPNELINKLQHFPPRSNVFIEDNILEYKRITDLVVKDKYCRFILSDGVYANGEEKEYVLNWWSK